MGGFLQGRCLQEGSPGRAALKFECHLRGLQGGVAGTHVCRRVQYVAHRKPATEKLTVFTFVTIVTMDCSVSGFVPPQHSLVIAPCQGTKLYNLCLYLPAVTRMQII